MKYIDTGAQFSPCRLYRYSLWRVWDEDYPKCAFIGLNPSTADETKDDPTIRKCIGFAKAWGYGGLFMLNAFALRATDPKVMKAHAEPIGPENDHVLSIYAEETPLVVAAWGVDGKHRNRCRDVRRLIGKLHHLGLTKDGQPKHPLYLRGDTKPMPWIDAQEARDANQ